MREADLVAELFKAFGTVRIGNWSRELVRPIPAVFIANFHALAALYFHVKTSSAPATAPKGIIGATAREL